MKEEELIKEKEVKQNWIIPLIIILIILLVISGTLAYLFYYKNAEKFINQVKNEIVSLNNNILEFKDYKGKDIKYNGNLVVNEVGPFNYSLSLSTKENIFNIDLNYGDDLNKLDGKIIYQDERLSTVSAERILLEANVRREKRKTVIDQVAATIILQNYLDKIKK